MNTPGPLLKGKGIGRYLVIKTVEALKREQIGNICLFADAEGGARISAGQQFDFCFVHEQPWSCSSMQPHMVYRSCSCGLL